MSISPGQVGYLNGWGIFSTLRVMNGIPFAFERHYARLKRDALLMRVPFDLSSGELYDRLLSLVEANSAFDAVLRVVFVRNRGGLFEAPEIDRDCDLVAFTAPLTKWGSSVRLTYVPNGRFGCSPFAGAKITSWGQNLTWLEEARAAGFDEALLLNERGEISECTSANIFAIQGQHVLTPPLSTSGCLPGVTRAILLEEIQLDSVRIEERALTPTELESSDCVFITSTTRDLVPVLAVDDFHLRQEHAILESLQESFFSRRSAYLAGSATDRLLLHEAS